MIRSVVRVHLLAPFISLINNTLRNTSLRPQNIAQSVYIAQKKHECTCKQTQNRHKIMLKELRLSTLRHHCEPLAERAVQEG